VGIQDQSPPIKKIRRLITDLQNAALTAVKNTIVAILSELADEQAVKESPKIKLKEILAKFAALMTDKQITKSRELRVQKQSQCTQSHESYPCDHGRRGADK